MKRIDESQTLRVESMATTHTLPKEENGKKQSHGF